MNSRSVASKLLAWFQKEARDLPWRRTRDPYGIWVSEIMLQQTQVKTVIPYWERWMRELPTLESLARARPQKIHKLWEGLGYYSRVRNLQKAAQVIVEQHSGKFPEDFDQVLELPGIGRYTAGAICSIAFNQPRPILDGNVIRVLTRLRGIRNDPRERRTNGILWDLAEMLVVQAAALVSTKKGASLAASHLNQSLMELGAVVCTPRQPRCGGCPVAADCVAFRDGRVEELPATRPRARVTQRRFLAFAAKSNGRWLVRQRPKGVVNGQFWEFPNIEITNGGLELRQAARAALGFTPKTLVPLLSLKHSITRYRITLKVFSAAVKRTAPANASSTREPGRWLTRAQLDKLAFTGSHRKILSRLTLP